MWTTVTPLRSVAAGIVGATLFLGGLIYAFTSQSELERSSTISTTCLNRENFAIGGLDCTTGTRGEISAQALGSRVVIGTGLMVAGSVVLGAGIVTGRQRYRHAPTAPTGTNAYPPGVSR
ncbi:hypothetical protein ACIGO9_31175 [Nocardia asteroides]|uniref:hypothetical protein n=1 Tax=Nocardia asteroides TaxID=1824 RepID=UPI0037CC35F3